MKTAKIVVKRATITVSFQPNTRLVFHVNRAKLQDYRSLQDIRDAEEAEEPVGFEYPAGWWIDRKLVNAANEGGEAEITRAEYDILYQCME